MTAKKKKRGKKYPAWSKKTFKRKKSKPPEPKPCAQCGKISIPQAHAPGNKKKYFCSMACGKMFLRGYV